VLWRWQSFSLLLCDANWACGMSLTKHSNT
jgi:hypothetical protein